MSSLISVECSLSSSPPSSLSATMVFCGVSNISPLISLHAQNHSNLYHMKCLSLPVRVATGAGVVSIASSTSCFCWAESSFSSGITSLSCCFFFNFFFNLFFWFFDKVGYYGLYIVTSDWASHDLHFCFLIWQGLYSLWREKMTIWKSATQLLQSSLFKSVIHFILWNTVNYSPIKNIQYICQDFVWSYNEMGQKMTYDWPLFWALYIKPYPPADGDVTSLHASSLISLLLMVTRTFSGFMSVWMIPQCVCI